MVIPSAGTQPRVLAGTSKRELACRVGPVPLLPTRLEVPGHLCQGSAVSPKPVQVWCLLPQQAGEGGPGGAEHTWHPTHFCFGFYLIFSVWKSLLKENLSEQGELLQEQKSSLTAL